MTIIAAIGIICAALALLLRREHPSVSMAIGIAAGVLILTNIADYVVMLVTSLENFAQEHNMHEQYISLILKAKRSKGSLRQN